MQIIFQTATNSMRQGGRRNKLFHATKGGKEENRNKTQRMLNNMAKKISTNV